ncbi:hypothetical protein H2201_008969, partial [Coniosporium apollinis]
MEPDHDASDPGFWNADSEEMFRDRPVIDPAVFGPAVSESPVVDPAILEPSNAGYADTVVTEAISGRGFEDDDSANGVRNNPAEDSDGEQIASDDEDFYGDEDLEPAEELYEFDNVGVEDLNPRPLKRGKPWNSLPSVRSAVQGPLTLYVGDTVFVCCTDSHDHLAKVTDLRDLEDGRYVVVFAWYYSRADIKSSLERKHGRSKHLSDYLNRHWPETALYRYMLSSDRIITLWDTVQRKAPYDVLKRICPSAFYIDTVYKQKI